MFNFVELNFDSDGDGIADSYAEELDLDGDGIVDALNVDTDGDGFFDSIYMDTDGDGEIDTFGIDTDGDGVFDMFYRDTNGDGAIDTYETNYDSDGDGEMDIYKVDHDYDQDGNIDSSIVRADNDHDGIFDEVTKAYDSDGDGQIDTITTYYDTDGDGKEDAVVEERFLDTDGDGVADTYIYGSDLDADGDFETLEVYDYDNETGEIELLDFYMDPVEEGGTYYIEPEQFDPDSADMDAVSGDPGQSMEEWEYQGDTGRCALYSQKFVIEELTGEELDIEEMADLAEENGWFSEEGGTPLIDMNKVLDYYGVDNTMSFHNDIDDIKECLDSGGKVIVALDADEIWYGETDDLFSPTSAPNHAVEVIGIDYSNPDEPMVILNDSGTQYGCGEMVPLDIFLDAWEDGDCQMIACQ